MKVDNSEVRQRVERHLTMAERVRTELYNEFGPTASEPPLIAARYTLWDAELSIRNAPAARDPDSELQRWFVDGAPQHVPEGQLERTVDHEEPGDYYSSVRLSPHLAVGERLALQAADARSRPEPTDNRRVHFGLRAQQMV